MTRQRNRTLVYQMQSGHSNRMNYISGKIQPNQPFAVCIAMNSRKLGKSSEFSVNFTNMKEEPLPSAPPPYDTAATPQPQSTQEIPTQHSAYGGASIIMMGDIAYEQVQTPYGHSLIRRTLGSNSCHLTCQFCNKKIDTVVESITWKELMGKAKWTKTIVILAIISLLCFLITVPIFICIFCGNKTKHSCPICQQNIGFYRQGVSEFFYTAGKIEDQYAEWEAHKKLKGSS